MQENQITSKEFANYEEEIDLLDLIRIIWKGKYIIIILTLLFTIVGMMYALTRESIYKSELTFIEESMDDSSLSSLSSIANSLPFGMGSSLSSGNSSKLPIILESRTFRERLITELKLYDFYLLYKGINLNEVEAEEMIPNIYDVADWVKDIVQFLENEKNGVYTVSVELKDKKKAKEIANGYFRVLDEYIKEESLTKSKLARRDLEHQIRVIEEQIDSQQQKIRDLEEKYNTVSIVDEAKIVTETVVVLKQDIIKAENELKVMSKFSGENSLEFKTKKEQLSVMKDQLYSITEGKKDLPVDIIPLKDIPKIKFELQKLEQELTVNLEVYKMLRVQLEQKRITVDNKSTIRILDTAIEAKHPIKPNKKLIVMISVILGGFIGILLVFILELIKNFEWEKITE